MRLRPRTLGCPGHLRGEPDPSRRSATSLEDRLQLFSRRDPCGVSPVDRDHPTKIYVGPLDVSHGDVVVRFHWNDPIDPVRPLERALHVLGRLFGDQDNGALGADRGASQHVRAEAKLRQTRKAVYSVTDLEPVYA